eukprot:3993305-Pyramimonas_sp.AAC.1
MRTATWLPVSQAPWGPVFPPRRLLPNTWGFSCRFLPQSHQSVDGFQGYPFGASERRSFTKGNVFGRF